MIGGRVWQIGKFRRSGEELWRLLVYMMGGEFGRFDGVGDRQKSWVDWEV